MFDHDRLDVYQLAVNWIVIADDLARCLPKSRGDLGSPLRLAAVVAASHIAEGAGEFTAWQKARSYRSARRAHLECTAILDACGQLDLLEERVVDEAREDLARMTVMLTSLVRRQTERARRRTNGTKTARTSAARSVRAQSPRLAPLRTRGGGGDDEEEDDH